MNSPIFSDGKEYISAIRASKKIGYASDYIGQLCRAKKIPGQLIGRTWYVDFNSLLEHKKNRRLRKIKKLPFQELSALALIEKSAEIIVPKSLNKVDITYENDDRPRLPELLKKTHYTKPVKSIGIFKKATIVFMSLVLVTNMGLFLLQRTAPSLATEVREQLAAVSLFGSMDRFFENVVAGFHNLKEIAFDKFFFSSPPTQQTGTVATSSKVETILKSDTVAVTNLTQPLNLESLRQELKEELENYIRIQIGSVSSPVVVYSSSPTLATADFDSFKTNEVVPVVYYAVTNQSDSDSGRLSSIISNLTSDGQFTKATFGTICFSTDCRTSWPASAGSSVSDFAWTTTSYGVSTSTTLGFLSGFLSTASSTIDANLIVTGNSTTTNATTTNFFSTTASSTNLFSSSAIFSNLLLNGSSTLQNLTFTNATGTSATTTNFSTTVLTAASNNLVVNSSGLDINAATDISGDLTISSGAALTISATGPINQTGTGQVTFAGNVDATNGLDVTTSNLTVGGSNFTVAPATGNTVIAGTLDVTGILEASSTLQATGAALFYSTLRANGALTAAGSGTGLSVTNNATIGGTLGLTGAGTFSSTLDVTGALSAASLVLNSGTLSLNNQKITGLADPTTDQEAATKFYVDAVAQGLSLKDSVAAGTTANITLSGEQTVDGISLVAGDRVLVKDQTDRTKNGIYVVASGVWSRSTDADEDSEVLAGMFTFINDGTVNASSGWVLTTTGVITLGTSLLDFTQFSGAGQIVAGTGLTKSANTLNVIGTANRITANADSIDIASTYVGQTSITTVGALTSGSLGSGFGNISIGSSSITGGAATFSSIEGSAITGSGNLTVSGTSAFTGNVSVTGTLTAATTTLSGDLAMGGKKITGLADPTAAQEAATKAYVDAIAQGLTVKASVRVGTTANITLSGEQTIDGVSAVTDDRVLVKNQTTGTENGIYSVVAGAWSRSTDADENSEVVSGLFTFVTEGTTQANTGWSLITPNTITLGSTSLTFTQFSGSAEVIAGNGLTKTGNTLNTVGTADRITATADAIDIASTYVGQNSIITVGALTSGSIASGFGSINIGSSALTAGTSIFQTATSYGTLSVGGTATTTIVGNSATSTFSGGITLASGNVNLATGGNFLINDALILNATTLGSSVLSSSLTSVGALDAGSITTGFGDINIGANTLDAGTTTVKNLIVQNTSTSTFAGPISSPSGDLIVASQGTSNNLLFNPYGGNVGIGTTSPSRFFEVARGAENASIARFDGLYSNDSSYYDVEFATNGNVRSALRTYISGVGGAIALSPSINGTLTDVLLVGDDRNVAINASLNNLRSLNVLRSTTLNDGDIGYGIYSEVTAVNGAGTNIGGYFSASGSANNYGLIVGGGNVGIGTTSPYARLSVEHLSSTGTVIGADSLTGFTGNLLDLKVASTTKFSVNQAGDVYSNGSTTLQNFTFNNATGTSATTTNFFSTTASSTNLFSSLLTVGGTGLVVDSSRNVGIGTTNPTTKLDIVGDIKVEDVSGSTLFNMGGNQGAANGQDAILTLESSLGNNLTLDTRRGLHPRIYSAANNDLEIYAGGTGHVLLGTGAGNFVGVGTTTPTWLLNPTSATASQLALSAGAGFSQWAFRNAGGNLYFATTTVAGTATSSVSALSIDTNGLLSVNSITTTGLGTFNNLLADASSTLQNFTFQNATGTSATTTNFFSTTASSTNLFFTTGSGGDFTVGGQLLVSSGSLSAPGIAFTTQPDNGIFMAGIDDMGFASNGNQVLTISNGSFVGIQETSPEAILEISADGSVSDPLFYLSSNDDTNGDYLTVLGTGNVGIGTTTPTWLLNPYSATAPQLVLSAGAGFAQWAFRNAGGNLYFATTTVAGTATTSTSALTIIGSSGNIGVGTTSPYAKLSIHAVAGETNSTLFAIGSTTAASVTTSLFSVDNTGLTTVGNSSGTGDADFQFAADANAWSIGYNSTDKSFNIASSTNFSSNVALTISKGSANLVGVSSTTPWRTLSVNGTAALNGLSAVSGTDASVCIDATTKEVTTQAGDTCAASSRRFKNSISTLPDTGLDMLRTLNPVSFKYNGDISNATYWGFIAEEAASTSPQLAYFNPDGTAQTINSTAILSVTVKALKEFDLNLATIASATTSSALEPQSFAANFFEGLFSRIRTWLADAANGIGDFFVNRVRTKELCVRDESGGETCITKAQLDILLGNTISSGGGTIPIPEPEPPVSEPEQVSEEPPATESVTEEPVVEEPIVEEPAPTPESEPVPEAEPVPVVEQESTPAPESVETPPAEPTPEAETP